MKNILAKFPDKLSDKIIHAGREINEITLRSGKNVVIKCGNSYRTVGYITSSEEVSECFRKICDMSVYAYLDELRSGFITIDGGHRVGICGTTVLRDGEIYNIKNISSLNIRIAREAKGCADKLCFDIKNLLIISPPGCGKTTLLRDLCRKLGRVKKVSVIDERGEIAGMHNSMPCFDIGDMTDVMSLCDKRYGIETMLRSMSPDYIVTDEIAEKDCGAIRRAVSCGVNIIASAHGDSIDSTVERISIEKHLFDNIVLLGCSKGIGTIEKIYSGGRAA